MENLLEAVATKKDTSLILVSFIYVFIEVIAYPVILQANPHRITVPGI